VKPQNQLTVLGLHLFSACLDVGVRCCDSDTPDDEGYGYCDNGDTHKVEDSAVVDEVNDEVHFLFLFSLELSVAKVY